LRSAIAGSANSRSGGGEAREEGQGRAARLRLDPSRKDLEGPLKQVLTGLASVVSGIAGTSNKVGDRHVRTYKPGKRHALLVVDSAKTLANFLLETQLERREASR